VEGLHTADWLLAVFLTRECDSNDAWSAD